MKFDKKYSVVFVAFFMTLALDTTMTFTMVSVITGWTPVFLQRFLQGWLIGFAVAFPTSILAFPVARRLASSLVSE